MNADDKRHVEWLRIHYVHGAQLIERLSAREQELVKENERLRQEVIDSDNRASRLAGRMETATADALEEAARAVESQYCDDQRFNDILYDYAAVPIRALIPAQQEKQKDAET